MPVIDEVTGSDEEAKTGALIERLFGEGLGGFHIASVYLGLKLGLWAALSNGPCTTKDLARTTELDPAYVWEWVQAEVIAGLITVDDDDLDVAQLTLATGVRAVLLEETAPTYLGGLPIAFSSLGGVLPELVSAYRTGAGVPYSAYGAEAVSAQAAINRPTIVNELVATWIPGIPGALERLSDTSRPAHVADVGCGVGYAAIELAKAFPHITVDGLDFDEESIARARRNAVEAGVADRVTFDVCDISASEAGEPRYDLTLFIECLHDMARPVEALAAARSATRRDGSVVVVDEKVSDSLTAPQEPGEMFFALSSALWCLPQSRASEDCEAPGAVMRASTFEAFVLRAGWSGTTVLPIENPFFRFYRLDN